MLDPQRIVSHTAATLIESEDPEGVTMWQIREWTHQRMIRETRDLGGQLGDGGLAAGQGSLWQLVQGARARCV